MNYAITLASFRKIEPIEETLATLAKQGYEAIEMFGEPSEVDAKKLRDTFSSYNLPVCGITGMWGSISPDGWKRKLLQHRSFASASFRTICHRLRQAVQHSRR